MGIELVISIVVVILSVILVLIILAQKSKGGGLASNFSSGNQILGVRKTTDTIEKITWTLIAIIVVLCIASSIEGNINKESTASQVPVEMPAQTNAVPQETPVE